MVKMRGELRQDPNEVLYPGLEPRIQRLLVRTLFVRPTPLRVVENPRSLNNSTLWTIIREVLSPPALAV
jgi:hypothetical protein